MTNTIDFLRETAAYMVHDRPDIYTHEAAVEELSTAMDSLREEPDRVVGVLSFTSYILTRFLDDGFEEFILSRKLSSVVLYEEDEDCRAFAYSREVDLPHILDDELLDDPDDDVLD